MSLFRKRKPKYSQITSVNQIKAHLREFILDSQIHDADLVSQRLGCPPISDDVMEREEAESDRRVESISFLIPLLYGYSALFAEAFVSTMVPSEDELDSPQMKKMMGELSSQIQHTFEDAMAHLLIGSVSQMVDLELLTVPKGR